MSKNTPINREPQAEKFERFVSLDAGQFWKVISVGEGYKDIEVGEILLITNIDYVDNQAHTITVRIHPSKQSRSFPKESLFRVDDFLNNFEHVEKDFAENERSQRLAEIQGRINDAQIELTQASADTNTLDAFVERDAPKEDKDSQLPVVREALPNGVVGAIKSQKVTALMTKGLTDNGVSQIKSAMQHQVSVIEKRAGWLKSKTNALASIASEMTPYFEEQAAVALAETSEMRKHIDKLMKGIDTLDLYTLKDVEVFTIQEGQSAPSDVKLTIAQAVLYMDEEMAVYEPVHSEFDCRDRQDFFDALAKHEDLVNQIFPTERCVVGMATTRHHREYEGYHATTANNLRRSNALVFFLVRDGSNLYGVVSNDVMHQFTSRLFPSLNEMERPFRGVRGEDITYESIQYTKSLSKFEEMSLAYKRILILLCGLDHNKQLFGDFYEENASLEFVTLGFQEKYINFIYDDDGTNMFKGSSVDKPKITEWLADVNTTITSGSRLLINWRDCFTTDTIPSAFERESQWHGRDHNRSMLYTPVNESKNGFIEVIAEIQNGKTFVTIPLSGHNNRYEERELNGRLSIDLAFRSLNSKFSIICLDRVNPDDLKYYLHNRNARALNVPAIKAVKEAISIAEQNYVEEQPFRAEMYKALEAGGVSKGTDALKLISDAIAVFRCANKGEKLSVAARSPKKYQELLDQMFMLSGKGGDPTEEIRKAEEKLGRTVIRISLDTKGVYVAYSTPLERERDDRLAEFLWVARTRYKATAKGPKPQKPTFAKFHARPANETIKYEVENYGDYVFPDTHHWNTPNAKEKALSTEIEPKALWSTFEEAKLDESLFEEFIDDFLSVRSDASKKYVEEPMFIIPIATAMRKNGVFGRFGLALDSLSALIYLCDNNLNRIRKARHAYGKTYHDKESAFSRFNKALDRDRNKSFLEMAKTGILTDTSFEDSDFIWAPQNEFYECSRVVSKQYSVQAVLDENMKSYIFVGEIKDADEFFGITKPEDYKACALKRYDGFRREWNGYSLYDLTDEILEAIKNRDVYVNHYFDTHREAENFMSNQGVNRSNGDGTFSEIFYVEVNDHPSDLTDRKGNTFKPVKSWKYSTDVDEG